MKVVTSKVIPAKLKLYHAGIDIRWFWNCMTCRKYNGLPVVAGAAISLTSKLPVVAGAVADSHAIPFGMLNHSLELYIQLFAGVVNPMRLSACSHLAGSKKLFVKISVFMSSDLQCLRVPIGLSPK